MTSAVFLPEYKEMLTPDDVRQVIRIGRNTVYDYLKTGKLKSKMIAGKYRIPKISLWEFLYPDRPFPGYDQSTNDMKETDNEERKDF